MADYAGAVEAIQDRFTDAWSVTPVIRQNEAPEDAIWPPVDGNGLQTGWVYLEVIGNGSALRAAGTPGNQVWLTQGHVLIHVYTPLLDGTATAHQRAVAAGEIFRAKSFYRDEAAGAEVRTWAPWADGGEVDAEAGNYFRVTVTVPFDFYHRG